jgi:ACT domain-containing protein
VECPSSSSASEYTIRLSRPCSHAKVPRTDPSPSSAGTAADTRTSVIVTALGADKHGLLASVATTVARMNANVDDVSQTVTGGMFTMIMFVSFADAETTLADLQAALAETSRETGLQITVQHEDIFRFMHRI